MKFLLLAAGCILIGSSCTSDLQEQVSVEIDFTIPAGSPIRDPGGAGTGILINDLASLKLFVESSDFRSQLAAASQVTPSSFVVSLDQTAPTVPLVVRLKADSKATLDLLLEKLPEILKSHAKKQKLHLADPLLKIQG